MPAARLLEESWRAGATEAEIAASEASIDLEAEEFSCPACGASFPKAGRCPGCGLNLGF